MTLEREGLFDVSVHKSLLESDLQPETIFECLLTIPGTSFTAKADSMYLKGQGMAKAAGDDPLNYNTFLFSALSSDGFRSLREDGIINPGLHCGHYIAHLSS